MQNKKDRLKSAAAARRRVLQEEVIYQDPATIMRAATGSQRGSKARARSLEYREFYEMNKARRENRASIFYRARSFPLPRASW